MKIIGLVLVIMVMALLPGVNAQELQDCSTDINQNIMGIPLDTSLSFPSYYLGEMTCDEVDSKKLWCELNETAEGKYECKGFRLWWIVASFLIIFIIWLVRRKVVFRIKRYDEE